MRYVADASLVASLFLPDEASDRCAALMADLVNDDDEAAAPGLLQLEVTNILLMAFRRKRITGVQLKQVSEAYDQLPISLQPTLTREQRNEVHRLADKHALSAYDAAYLELTMRLGTPLASLDEPLLKAAKLEGVKPVL